MRKLGIIVFAILVLNSCYTTPASNVALNVDFTQYTTAVMPTKVTGSNVVLKEASMKIQNALISHWRRNGSSHLFSLWGMDLSYFVQSP